MAGASDGHCSSNDDQLPRLPAIAGFLVKFAACEQRPMRVATSFGGLDVESRISPIVVNYLHSSSGVAAVPVRPVASPVAWLR